MTMPSVSRFGASLLAGPLLAAGLAGATLPQSSIASAQTASPFANFEGKWTGSGEVVGATAIANAFVAARAMNSRKTATRSRRRSYAPAPAIASTSTATSSPTVKRRRVLEREDAPGARQTDRPHCGRPVRRNCHRTILHRPIAAASDRRQTDRRHQAARRQHRGS